MKTTAAILLAAVGAGHALAQPVCPPINFQQLAQVQLQNRPQSILTAMVRQADQSFSGTEIYTGSTPGKSTMLVGVVPNIQKSLFTCSGLSARNPGPGPSPNLSRDPLGTSSRNTIITDLPGNGVGSIVGLSRGHAGQVVVVSGTPGYTIGSAQLYPVGLTPQGVLSGDFNGDGKRDIAVVYFGPLNNAAPGGVSLLLGAGNGDLQPAVNYPTGLAAIAATAYDFNADGKDDLAVANNSDGSVTILFGNSNGKLTTGNTYSTGIGSFPTSIAVADVNGDGKPDLMVSTIPGIVTLLGNGDGTFRTGQTTAIMTDQSFLAAGDFNKDGKVDVAVTDYDSGFLSILQGNGDGTFKSASQYLIGYAPGTFYVEDIDGDGNLDIAFAAGHPDALITLPYTQTVGVLFGNGDGTFAGAPAYLVGGNPNSLVVADFNGDGKPDLAIAGAPILLGTGNGRFQAGPTPIGGGGTYVGIAAGDLNGDGKLDLAANDGQNGASVSLGNGDGTFQAQRTVAGGGNGTSFLALGDFNNDRKLDLAVANHDSNSISIMSGNGDGSFKTALTTPVGSKPTYLVTGDFNGDGKLDLAVANSGHIFTATDPGSLSILLGKGDGTFQSAVNYTASSNLWPNSVSAADLNHDGITDLVLTAATDNFGYAMLVFLGNGDGSFKAGVLYPTSFGAGRVAIADFNGDGKLDIVLPHCCGDTEITYLLGNGDGTFQKEAHISNGGASSSAVADFNGDGKPDVAFIGTEGAAFVFLNAPAVVAQPTITNVISASGFGALPGIAAGSWIEIYGTNLAGNTRLWAGSDFTGVNAPTALDGTGVQVNGKAAFVYYISPGQVDALIPSGLAAGPAIVSVSVGGVTSAPLQVTALSVAPGMLAPASFLVQGKQYVVAQFTDGTYVLPTGAIAGVSSRPAKPGETIVIYGIGFGPAENAAHQIAPVGQIASESTNLTSSFGASFGSTAALVSYSGLGPGNVGLYQFNIQVPVIADNEAVPFSFTLGGAAGSQTLYTAVHQ